MGTTIAERLSPQEVSQLTAGRKPFSIIPYETAVKSLQECLDIPTTKAWDNLADAYVAWAKIHNDDKIMRLARMLKLRAAEHMGVLALKLKPDRPGRNNGGRHGQGAAGVLKKTGMTSDQAAKCIHLARNPEAVTAATQEKKPPAARELSRRIYAAGNLWSTISQDLHWAGFARGIQQHSPGKAAAAALSEARNAQHIRDQAEDLAEWLFVFRKKLGR